MNSAPDFPIKWKLTLITVLTSAVVLFAAGASLITYETIAFREAAANRISTMAEIVGANSASALAFHNLKVAKETLATLRERRDIVCAGLYAADGTLFASIRRGNRSVPPSVSLPEVPPEQFDRGDLLVFRPIQLGDDVVGAIFLRVSLIEQQGRLNIYMGAVGFLMVFLLVAALFLGTRLQRIVSDPVLDLADVAAQVKSRKDYSLRARKRSNDEIGLLVDSFNQMLMQIQQRDATLHDSEERFRQLAESIHEVFWLVDAASRQIIYVSPAYEQIWGRTCANLYASPQDWLEAIHPEDRERVRQAAQTRQHLGEYDEQYRILQPGGALRWIRDRAFLIKDANGDLVRVAGIAEDITERKMLEREVLEISSAEQRRIGHDLHDGLGQHLTSIAFMAKLLEDTLLRSAPEHAHRAQQIVSLVNDAVGQARSLARGLDPIHVEADGLVPALDQLAADTEKLFLIPCAFNVSDSPLRIDRFASLQLYHIVREAVGNAVKHAKPKHIEIEMSVDNRQIVLSVRDDGGGFYLSRGRQPGLGLRIMQYRALSIGAVIQIDSRPGAGTGITCTLPAASADGTGEATSLTPNENVNA